MIDKGGSIDMEPTVVLYSLLCMFLVSFFTGMRMLQLRYRAVLKDNLHHGYFKLNRGAKLPDYLIQATQHYENLYETPLLFYVIVILAYLLKVVDVVTITLAYSYVVTRVVHAFIHLNSNRVRHRRNVFLISIAVLTTLWIYVFIKL